MHTIHLHCELGVWSVCVWDCVCVDVVDVCRANTIHITYTYLKKILRTMNIYSADEVHMHLIC